MKSKTDVREQLLKFVLGNMRSGEAQEIAKQMNSKSENFPSIPGFRITAKSITAQNSPVQARLFSLPAHSIWKKICNITIDCSMRRVPDLHKKYHKVIDRRSKYKGDKECFELVEKDAIFTIPRELTSPKEKNDLISLLNSGDSTVVSGVIAIAYHEAYLRAGAELGTVSSKEFKNKLLEYFDVFAQTVMQDADLAPYFSAPSTSVSKEGNSAEEIIEQDPSESSTESEASAGVFVENPLAEQSSIQEEELPIEKKDERNGDVSPVQEPGSNVTETKEQRYDAATQFVFPCENLLPKLDLPYPHTNRYLGYFRHSSTFSNFFPTSAFRGCQFFPVSDAEAKDEFPRLGGLNICRDDLFLYPENTFYILDLDPKEIIANLDEKGQVRKDFACRAMAVPLEQSLRLRPASDFGGYPVLYPAEPLGRYPSGRVYLRASNQYVSPLDNESEGHRTKIIDAALHSVSFTKSQILLADGDHLYGPLTVYSDGANNPFVNLDGVASDGLLPGFLWNEYERRQKLRVTLNVQQGTKLTRIGFDFVFASSLKAVRFDICPVKVLFKVFEGVFEGKPATLADVRKAVEDDLAVFSVDASVHAARRARLIKYLAETKADRASDSDVVELVKKIISGNSTNAKRLREEVIDSIFGETDLSKRINEHPEIRKFRKQIDKEIRDLENQKKKLEDECNNEVRKAREHVQKQLSDLTTDLEHLKKQKEILHRDIESYRDRLGALVECETGHEVFEQLKMQTKELQDRRDAYKHDIEGLDEHLRKEIARHRDYAFDGALASKFLSAAAQWDERQVTASFDQRGQAYKSLSVQKYEGRLLRDYLVREVRTFRPYADNEILNLFLTVSQTFLTIFAGPPGIGKTSICDILGYVLGLSTIDRHFASMDGYAELWQNPEDANRYLPVSVERGWTSKRDFVGFYNAITQTFESPDARRHEAFKQLDAEARSGFNDVPYIFLLDEANLSPMEFYWADFMNIADRRTSLSTISLGDRYRCRIPDTLRFLATVNNDFTTENLSPRLLDRVAVLTLPRIRTRLYEEHELDLDMPKPILSWKALKEFFRSDPDSKERLQKQLQPVYDVFDELDLAISPRVQLSVLDYVSAAARVFGWEGDRSPDSWAIDYAIAQRLLPKINGSGEQYEQTLRKLLEMAKNSRWIHSEELIAQIIHRGDHLMGDYSFF